MSQERPPVRLQAFCIYDKAAQAYMPPFFMPSIAMAIRAFGSDCSNPQTQFAKHPHDFDLYHVGAFDDFTAEFVSFLPDRRIVVSRASDFVKEV